MEGENWVEYFICFLSVSSSLLAVCLLVRFVTYLRTCLFVFLLTKLVSLLGEGGGGGGSFFFHSSSSSFLFCFVLFCSRFNGLSA